MPIARRHCLRVCLATAVGWGLNPWAAAHGNQTHKPPTTVRKEQKDWGVAGEAAAVARTVEVRMSDQMRFTPDRVEVRQGQTLRFRVHNDGKVMHEFVIGTKAENAKHADMMVKFPDMEHDEPHMAHVGPGRVGEVIWTFNRAGRFEFACLIAGHYQANMTGTIVVTAPTKA